MTMTLERHQADGETAKTLFTVESTAPFIYNDHHARFRVEEILAFHPDNISSSRPSTPAEDEAATPAPGVHTKTYLRFTVDNIGQQTSFVFGSLRESCDVWITATPPTSRRLFAVELQHGGRSAMLQNLSSRGLEIRSATYKPQRFQSRRALHPGDPVTVFLDGFLIHVQFCAHNMHTALHNFYLQQLRPQLEQAMPNVNQLGIHTIPTTSAQSQASYPYQLYDEIGSGAFGTVFRARHCHTGALVAIKVFRKQSPPPWKEAAILQSLSHPNIVRFIHLISPGAGSGMLVMELLEHPNLEDAHEEEPLLIEHTKNLVAELLLALDYLHAQHITHRDLKPSNIILVSRNPVSIKVTDFGLAAERSDQLQTNCGTARYVAPEVRKRSYTNKVDMWAVGVIALELGAGLPRYPRDGHGRQSWPSLLRKRLKSNSVDPLLCSFVEPLLGLRPDLRPSANMCLQHCFVQNGSHLPDALGSPTEYAPTPPEYRVQLASYQPESSSAARYRSANAPSPPDYGVDAGQTQILAPLLEDTLPPVAAPGSMPASPVLFISRPKKGPPIHYWELKHAGRTVMYRPDNGLVNITQLLKTVGHHQQYSWLQVARELGGLNKTTCHGRRVGGLYLSLQDGERVLRHFALSTLPLQALQRQIQEYT